MRKTIYKQQLEQLQRLREVLGESRFQWIQSDVWCRFSQDTAPITSDGILAPLALLSVWDEMIHAFRRSEPRLVAPPTLGGVVAIPQVGGLHHRYDRRAA